jgi:hypothetical protein
MLKASSMECRIGGLRLSPIFLTYDDTKERDAETDNGPYHLFVVEVRGRIASIFVGGERSHSSVAAASHLNSEDIQGGGHLYLNHNHFLVLDGFSGCFGSIPGELLQQFVALIAETLRESGTSVAGTKVTSDPKTLNDFWEE